LSVQNADIKHTSWTSRTCRFRVSHRAYISVELFLAAFKKMSSSLDAGIDQ